MLISVPGKTDGEHATPLQMLLASYVRAIDAPQLASSLEVYICHTSPIVGLSPRSQCFFRPVQGHCNPVSAAAPHLSKVGGVYNDCTTSS